MKGFKKLALVTAISALPMTGFAMQALDDATLSGVTGQDGIRIQLGTEIEADIIIHDKDGYTGDVNFSNAGAIILAGFGLTFGTPGDTVQIDIDAGKDSSDAAVLNIGVTTPANMTLALGNLEVAASNKATTTDDGNWGTVAGSNIVVANLGSLTLGSTSLNIQLGSEPQGNMIATTATITGGVTLSNFALLDANSGGGIRIGSLSITNSGGTDLEVDAGIDIDASAMVIQINQMGDATDGADLRIHALRLGNAGAAVLGDIEINGLDLTGTIRISGK
ncbi:MAG: DUF6160 family protein [Alcanivoracaceae bacterium]